MVPILQFKWTHHSARLFRAELYLYMIFVTLTTAVSLMLTTERSQMITYSDAEYTYWDAERGLQAWLIIIQFFISLTFGFRYTVHL